MIALSIETSCDETSVAIVDYTIQNESHNFRVLSHVTLSQIDLHRPYGGVFPTVARREHQTNCVPVLVSALEQADMVVVGAAPHYDQSRIDSALSMLDREPELAKHFSACINEISLLTVNCIFVTHGPGLEPALWVGVNFANALGRLWNIAVLPVNHMEGHIYSVFAKSSEFTIPKIETPVLSFLISGGHTEIVLSDTIGSYNIVGQTCDDAIGEAFDKVARIMGLPYPGGPEISKLTEQCRNLQLNPVLILGKALPRPMLHSTDLQFSFSGLKTAVRYLVESLGSPLSHDQTIALACEFEDAVRDVCVYKLNKAIEQFTPTTVIVAGGVSANKTLQQSITMLCERQRIPCLFPAGNLSGDNALMIAVAGCMRYSEHTQNCDSLSKKITANGSLVLS